MLFESECAFFMSSAAAAAATATATATAIATLATTTITTTAAAATTDGGITVTLPEPPEVVALAALSRAAITSTSSKIISVDGEVVRSMAHSPKATEHGSPKVVPKEHSSQTTREQPVEQPSAASVPQQAALKEEPSQCLNHDQPEQQQQQRSMDKRKKRLKPRSIATGACYEISGRSKTESDVTPKCQAAPPKANGGGGGTTKSKTHPEVAPRAKVKTITKAALSAIISKQLMASGGQGLGVGIDKDLPFTKPPVAVGVRKSAVASGGSGAKKSSTSNVSSSSKATATTTYSSESSGDPMPDHFADLAEES